MAAKCDRSHICDFPILATHKMRYFISLRLRSAYIRKGHCQETNKQDAAFLTYDQTQCTRIALSYTGGVSPEATKNFTILNYTICLLHASSPTSSSNAINPAQIMHKLRES